MAFQQYATRTVDLLRDPGRNVSAQSPIPNGKPLAFQWAKSGGLWGGLSNSLDETPDPAEAKVVGQEHGRANMESAPKSAYAR